MGRKAKLTRLMGEVKASLLKLEERTDPSLEKKAAEYERLHSALGKLPLNASVYVVAGDGYIKNAVRVSVSFTTDITFDEDGNTICSDGFKALNELELIDLDTVEKIQDKMLEVKRYRKLIK